jgi:hypothetical protein
MLCGLSVLLIVPATAQQAGQNPNQAAAKALLQAADKAIGASSVKAIAVTATGWIGSPGQQFAQGDLPRADLKSYTLIRDYSSKSAKTDYVRVQGNNPPRGGGGIPVQGEARTTEFVNGNSAWNLNAQGQPNPQPQAAADRQHMMLTGPDGFIRAALEAPNAAATDRYFARQNRTVKVVGFTTKVCDGPQPLCTRRLTGEFNNDNLLERVITWVPDPVLGDKMVEFRYSDYRDVGGGVKLPFRLHAHMGDHPLIPGGHNWMDLRVSDIKVNIPDAAQAVPDNVRTAQPAQVQVVKTQLAPGVVLMGGGTHNSVAVEFKDFVTVIEGPLNQQRSLAVIPKSRVPSPTSRSATSSTPTITSTILAGSALSLRKAQRSLLTTVIGPSISEWFWRRSRGRFSPTGCRSGRLRPQAPVSCRCRRSRITTRSPMAIRQSSCTTSMA